MSELNQSSTSQTTKKLQRISTKDIVLTGMFAALICVLAQIVIPTQPVPFTLTIFAIFLTGALLSPRYAFIAGVIYLALGIIGVPVFSNFQGGLQELTGKLGGYRIAYPFMAFIIAIFYQKIKKYKVLALAIGMVIALATCYLFGTVWFSVITNMPFKSAVVACVLPFILVDSIKIVLAIIISIAIRKTAFRYLA